MVSTDLDLFKVAVTGDTGYDVYTEYVEAYESDDQRLQKPEAVHDVYVPSGAAFTAIVFNVLLRPSPDLKCVIDYLLPNVASSSLKDPRAFSTLQKNLVHLSRLKRHPKNDDKVLRVTTSRPILDMETQKQPHVFGDLIGKKERPLKDKGFDLNYDLLVVHDGAGSWRHYCPSENHKGDALELLGAVLSNNLRPNGKPKPQGPRVLVNLNHDLPEVERDELGELRFAKNLPFWSILSEPQNLDKVCVICSINMLRQEGAAVSRRLSFEQTVEDIATDLLLFEKVQMLAKFKHLIIRLSMVGAVHIMTDGRKRTADLVFAPLAKSGVYRDPFEDGTIIGQNAILAASVAKILANRDVNPCNRVDYVSAMKSGITACMRAFDNGYQVPWDTSKGIRETRDGVKIIMRLLKNGKNDSAVNAVQEPYDKLEIRRDQTLGHAVVPSDILEQPPGSWSQRKLGWDLLKDAIDSPTNFWNPGQASNTTAISRINIGVAIVLFGHDRVFNQRFNATTTDDKKILKVLNKPELFGSSEEIKDHMTLASGKDPVLPKASNNSTSFSWNANPIHVPLMTFKNLVLVERKEIESIRSIRNLFKGYLDKCAKTHSTVPPISIAVFGPPGSGKSFGVKEIASEINDTLQLPNHGLEAIEYNVAQFRSVDELGDAITRASVINNEGKTPLIFFDEFDCAFDGRALGWLKYFLAPMQDGKFYGVHQTIKIARAIFVFAGGIYPSFNKFAPSQDDPPTGGRSEAEEAMKRLREFADQKGPDFVSRLRGHINILPVDADPGLVKPTIRRAIILRGLLDRRNLVAKSRSKIAYIDEDIVYALLTLDRYRHGARSMDAIIEMCTPIQGKIEKSSLPSRAQLNMHIDAEEFFIRMYRGRFRPNVPPPPDTKTEVSKPDDAPLPSTSASPPPPESFGEAPPPNIDKINNAGNADGNSGVDDPKPDPDLADE